MKRHLLITAILSLIFCSFNSKAQNVNTFYQSTVEQCDNDTLFKNLLGFENFGVKEHGTAGLLNTFSWLSDKYQSYGYNDIEIDTFTMYQEECYNLIVTKTGTKYPNKYLVISSHYDTYGGPGSDDNGTGTIIILEIARLLKDIDTEYSIRFCAFSGEEYGLIGSTHYVENVVVPEDHDLKLVFNIDCVGGRNGEVNSIIIAERDEDPPNANNLDSELYTDTLCTLVSLYSDLGTHITHAWATDYIPFMEVGYVITGLYEYNANYYCHGPNDIIANLDTAYFFQVARASIAGGLYFAEAYNSTGIDQLAESPEVFLYPNPARDILSVSIPDLKKTGQVRVFDMGGRVVLNSIVNANFTQLKIAELPAGIYSIHIEWNSTNRIIKRFVKR
jgi:aminopeptidase YwaD